jgi:hypothetical protein
LVKLGYCDQSVTTMAHLRYTGRSPTFEQVLAADPKQDQPCAD